MSTITQSTPTRNQLTNQYDFSKTFLFDNKYRKVNIAASGADVVLAVGTLIGAVGATYQVYASGTANIQLIGVCAEAVTIADGSNLDVEVCIAGRVAESKISLDGSDTLATVVANKTIRDRIASDSMGIELADGDELTADDNV